MDQFCLNVGTTPKYNIKATLFQRIGHNEITSPGLQLNVNQMTWNIYWRSGQRRTRWPWNDKWLCQHWSPAGDRCAVLGDDVRWISQREARENWQRAANKLFLEPPLRDCRLCTGIQLGIGQLIASLDQCLAIVYDDGPTLQERWVNVSGSLPGTGPHGRCRNLSQMQVT